MLFCCQVTAVVVGAISAVFWFWSAAIPSPLPLAYLSGPPKEVVDRLTLIGRLNTAAAASAGLSIALQALSTFASMPAS